MIYLSKLGDDIALDKLQIEQIIKQYDENFDLHEQVNQEVNYPVNSLPLFYKYDYFNLDDCACLISGLLPTDYWTVKQNSQEYNEAYNFILSLMPNSLFEQISENDYSITSDNLKALLSQKKIFIYGFNSDTTTSQEQTEIIGELNNQTALFQAEKDKLTTELQQLHSEIDRLKAELEQAQTLLAEKPKIEYVEVKDNHLETLLDEHGEHYAPDLAHAVNLWLSLYGNGKIKDDSHTNLSQVWIKHNTGYHEQQDGFTQAEKRIREITTPFKEWATARNKNYKK